LIPILLCGCAEKRVEVWAPKPPVQWEHVSTQPVRPVQEGYRLLTDQPTRGLFPAAMAVTRVAVVADGAAQATQPCLLTDPRNEFLQWNSALDDQMAISEVFPITERDLGGGEVEPEQMLAAFRALRARLGLVYAVNELSDTETEMFGVLYDTNMARAVASLHASAVSVVPQEDQKGAEPADLWQTDSRAVVRSKFEYYLRSCIRELIRQDEPPPAEAPTGWTPAGPIRPVEWPPKRFRTGG
jgi:hypothetical protein